MKPHAILFPAINQIDIVDIDAPGQPGEGEIRVRLELSGVSQGTEVWALTGRRKELTFPTIPGYQAVGLVEAVGEGVSDLQIGDRVVLHRGNVPKGYPETWMGTHQSVLITPVSGDPPVRKVPEGVTPEEAVLCAMAAVSLRGVDKLDVPLGATAVVTGQGLIGQAAAQLLRARGAYVIATDLSPKRLDLSQQYSADLAVDPRQADIKALVAQRSRNGADIVCDTTGRAGDFASWIDLLRPQGQLLMQGYYPDPINFDFFDTHLKQPQIAITCGIGDTQRTLDLIATGRLKWKEMITHRVPVAQAPQMYQRMREGDADMLGVVFDWEAS